MYVPASLFCLGPFVALFLVQPHLTVNSGAGLAVEPQMIRSTTFNDVLQTQMHFLSPITAVAPQSTPV